jgi:transcriptional regulator with XRE-family HTH domain
MSHRNQFAAWLRERRQATGLSQEQLAEKAGVHRTYISQLERDLKSPTLDVLAGLAEALEMNLKAFLGHFSRRLDS